MTPPTQPDTLREAVIHAAQEVPHYESCAGLRGPNECDCGVVAALERLAALASLPAQAVEPLVDNTKRSVPRRTGDGFDQAVEPGPLCTCGHRDINHSDISLDALGNCYQCQCRMFTAA